MTGECCHYDDGWDEGFEAGRKEAEGDTSVHLELLEAVAQMLPEHADVLREVATTIASWDLEKLVEKERKRVADLVKLYTEARAA